MRPEVLARKLELSSLDFDPTHDYEVQPGDVGEKADLERQRLIVLASASPRRKELLERIGLRFIVDPSDFPENLDRKAEPGDLATAVSAKKALAVAHRYPDAIVIAADTFGVLRGKVIGKPHTPQEARKMLEALSGRCHRVVTGFSILDTKNDKLISRSVETRVKFRRLSSREIESYVKTGEPVDKAGAYAIQGIGAVIIEKISGDYYNVMGLPLSALTEALKDFGVYVL